MLGGIIKGSLISISIKNGNQICFGQFSATNNPTALSAETFCNILAMHAKCRAQNFLSARGTDIAFVTSAKGSSLYEKNLSNCAILEPYLSG